MTTSADDQPSSFHRALGRCGCAACGGGAQRAEAAEVEWPSPAGSTGGAAAAVTYSAATGDVRVDALLSGTAWGTGGGGSSTTITYSFGLSASSYGSGYGYDEPLNGFAALDATGRSAVRGALDAWSAVADIDFVEVVEGTGHVGAMRFAYSAEPETAWAYYPSGYGEGGDVWLGPYFRGSAFEVGTYEWSTLVHEIGHALGLKHPHEIFGVLGTVPALPASMDWLGQSVMSYKDFAGDAPDYYTSNIYPDGPMALDILAIQHLYGANTTHNAGDTVYRFAVGERMFETIWDTGGIDVIDWSNQSRDAVIRLGEGAFSELGTPVTWAKGDGGGGRHPGTVAVAHGAEIENAICGSGDDELFGNTLDNRLEGGHGADYASASIGNDWLIGGTGADYLRGGSGDDVIMGGTNTDTLRGDAGIDILFGDSSADLLLAGDDDDVLVGGTGSDRLEGGSGWDVAVYEGLRRDFTIAQTKTGYSVRDDNRDDGYLGIDAIKGVQALLFDDGLYDLGTRKMLTVPPTLPDLDQLVLTA